MQKLLYILAILLIFSANSVAQNRRPVKNEEQLKRELFELNKAYHNHHIKVDLPDDNFLLVDFYKMSYWPEKEALNTIFDIAGSTVAKVSDSFKSTLTSKRIDIHAPIKNRPLSVRIREHNDGTDMLIINYDQQAPLKLGMDTIRILKTYEVQKDQEGQVEKALLLYTFVLKDIEDISSISKNEQLVEEVASALDKAVEQKRSKWNREDTWYHSIAINYTAAAIDGKEKLSVKNRGGILKGFDVTYYIGASVFRNNLSPFLEVGGSYKWRTAPGKHDYVRVSISTMPQFERISASVYNYYSLAFINAELGTFIDRKNTWIPVYETSLGFSYMLTDHPSLEPHEGYKIFWNYSLSPSVRITPEIFLLVRKGQDNYVWPGLTVSLKLF